MDSSPGGSFVHGILQEEYWSGLPCPPSGDLPDPVIEPAAHVSPALTCKFFTTEPPGKPFDTYIYVCVCVCVCVCVYVYIHIYIYAEALFSLKNPKTRA